MIEIKTNFGQFTNNEQPAIGLYLFRVVSAIPMTEDVVKNAVITKLEAELDAAAVNGAIANDKKEALKAEWSLLREGQCRRFKEKKFTHLDRDIYSYQYVLQVAQPRTRGGVLVDIIRNVYRGWNIEDSKVYCPTTDIAYQVIELGTDANKLLLTSSSEFNNFIAKKILTPEHNITLMTIVDTQKTYNRNSIAKVRYELYDNMVEAFEHKVNGTFTISDFSMICPPLRFIQVRNKQNGAYYFHTDYKTNPKLEFVDGVAVFWDGKKSRDLVMPYIPKFAEKDITMVNILQFSETKDFFFGDMRNSNINSRKVILHFMNRNKLFISSCDLRLRSNRIEGHILCSPKQGNKRKSYNFSVQSGSGYVGELIIPVDEKNSQEKAMEHAFNLIYRRLSGEDMTQDFAEYKNILFDMTVQEEDILSEWFSYCTKSMRKTDDSIVRTYITMKTNLEREYKEIGNYLNCYDFSKCQPIPRVVADKKLLENYYKTLQIEPRNIIIKSINNKKIKPISEIQPTIRFMVINDKFYRTGEFPLNRCYNVRTNEIELYYNKLKGEITHVKTQDRR